MGAPQPKAWWKDRQLRISEQDWPEYAHELPPNRRYWTGALVSKSGRSEKSKFVWDCVEDKDAGATRHGMRTTTQSRHPQGLVRGAAPRHAQEAR